MGIVMGGLVVSCCNYFLQSNQRNYLSVMIGSFFIYDRVNSTGMSSRNGAEATRSRKGIYANKTITYNFGGCKHSRNILRVAF